MAGTNSRSEFRLRGLANSTLCCGFVVLADEAGRRLYLQRDNIGLVPGHNLLNVGQAARRDLRENVLSGQKGATRFCLKLHFTCRSDRETNTPRFAAFRI